MTMIKNINTVISEAKELDQALAYSLMLRHGKKGKMVTSFIHEREFGNFPDNNLDGFVKKKLELQGHNLNFLKNNLQAEILFEIFPTRNDRVLVIIVLLKE